MSHEITTRSQIPTQPTGTDEDLPPNYAEILTEVKNEVRHGYVRAHRAANTEMIAMYWRIGKIIDDRQQAIETKLLERRGLAAHNFPATIPEDGEQVGELLTEPYRLDFTGLRDNHSERELEDALVGNIVAFLQELGVGFAFVGRQYVLRVGGEEFKPDLLFYHLNLRRYVVIELKTTPAEPSHLGQLGFYTAVIDDKVRVPDRDLHRARPRSHPPASRRRAASHRTSRAPGRRLVE